MQYTKKFMLTISLVDCVLQRSKQTDLPVVHCFDVWVRESGPGNRANAVPAGNVDKDLKRLGPFLGFCFSKGLWTDLKPRYSRSIFEVFRISRWGSSSSSGFLQMNIYGRGGRGRGLADMGLEKTGNYVDIEVSSGPDPDIIVSKDSSGGDRCNYIIAWNPALDLARLSKTPTVGVVRSVKPFACYQHKSPGSQSRQSTRQAWYLQRGAPGGDSSIIHKSMGNPARKHHLHWYDHPVS